MADEAVTFSLILRDRVSKSLSGIRSGLKSVLTLLGRFGNARFDGFSNLLRSAPRLILGVVRSVFSLRTALVALASTGAVAIFIKSLRDIAAANDQIAKSARALGTSVQFYTKLSFAAGQSGVQFEKLTVGVRAFNRAVGEFVQSGGGAGARGFNALGIRPADLRDANGELRQTEELFLDIADRIGAIGSEQERLNVLFSLFQESGFNFAVLFENGAEGIRDLLEEAERLGGVLTPEQARIAEEVTDAFGRLEFVVRGIRNSLLETFGPTLTTLTNQFAQFVSSQADRLAQIADALVVLFAKPSDLILQARKDAGEITSQFDFVPQLSGQLAEQEDAIRAAQRNIGFAFLEIIRSLVRVAFDLGIELAVGLTRGIVRGLIASLPLLAGVLRREIGPVFTEGVIAPVGEAIAKAYEFFGLSGLANDTRQGIEELFVQLGLSAEDSIGTSRALIQEFEDDIRRSVTNIGTVLEEEGVVAFENVRGTVEDFIPVIDELFSTVGGQADRVREILGLLFGTDASAGADSEQEGPAEKINRLTQAWTNFKTGFSDGFSNVTNGFQDIEAIAGQLGSTVAGAFQQMGAALVDAAFNATSFGDAFISVAQSVLQQIATLITQFLILQAVSALTGIPLGGTGIIPGTPTTPVAGVRRGGKIRGYAEGGRVFGQAPTNPNQDTVPAMLQPGEWVLRNEATSYYGDRIMAALNARMIPKGMLEGFRARVTSPSNGHFNEGGRASGGTAAATGPVPAVVVPSDRANEVFNGEGVGGLLQVLSDNAADVRSAIGV